MAPGLYNIVSDAENTSTLPIQVIGGRDYFVWQEVKLGALYARTKLQEVDAQTGKAGVLESKMIQVDPSIVIKPFPTDNNRQSTEVTVTGNSRQKLEELQGLKKEGLITEKDYLRITAKKTTRYRSKRPLIAGQAVALIRPKPLIVLSV